MKGFNFVRNRLPITTATRNAWRAIFDHYVFAAQEGVTEHIPEHRRGILGKLSASDIARLRAHLLRRLQSWK